MKKFIRKVAALGAGSAMLLGTLGGALAADNTLDMLPEPFVVNGAYADVAFVVGDAAAGKDDAAQTVLTGYFGGMVEDVAGLAGQIQSEEIKLQDNIATGTGLDTVYDDLDSSIFIDEEVGIGGTSYDMHTELQLSGTANQLDMETSLTSSDDKYDKDTKLEIKKDALKFCYVFDEHINLSSAVGSSGTISNNNPFDLKFLGKTYRIDQVNSNTSFSAQVGETWTGHPGETYSGNGITMEVISCDTSDCVVDFGGDQRTVAETNTISKGEIDVYLKTAVAGVGTADEALGTFIIGEDARVTYSDGNKFVEYCSPADGHGDPDCDKDNPDWVWDIKGLLPTTAGFATSGASGAFNSICIENDFEAYDYNKDPAGVGEYYGLPYGFIYVGVDSLTVDDSDYMDVTFHTETGNTEDLSNVAWAPGAAIVLSIEADQTEGLVIDQSNFNATPLTTDQKTDKVWLWTNSTWSNGAINVTHVFYEDSNNNIQYAGNLTTSDFDTTGGQIDFGYLNYGKTKSTDMKLSLWGNYSADDSVWIGVTPDSSLSSSDNLWFRIQTDVDKTGDGVYEGFGDTDNDESDEVVWGSTTYPSLTANSTSNFNLHVGGKQYDLRTGYGLIVEDTDSSGNNDLFIVKVPADQLKANVAIYEGGGAAVVEAVLKTDTTASGYDQLILVGGPCVNRLTADYLGVTYPACESASGIPDNKAIVQLVEKDSVMALIVAGWEQADTKRAAETVAAGGLGATTDMIVE